MLIIVKVVANRLLRRSNTYSHRASCKGSHGMLLQHNLKWNLSPLTAATSAAYWRTGSRTTQIIAACGNASEDMSHPEMTCFSSITWNEICQWVRRRLQQRPQHHDTDAAGRRRSSRRAALLRGHVLPRDGMLLQHNLKWNPSGFLPTYDIVRQTYDIV